MRPDLAGRAALVTGGTRGVGLAIGQALARHGATVWLTHRWGSVDDAEVAAAFPPDAPPPRVVEADAGEDEDTRRLLSRIAEEHERLDVLVSNVAVVGRGRGLDELSRRDFARGLRYSAWPLPRYLDAIRDTFGRCPRTVVATSSDGVAHHYPGYDYVALSKAALESLVASLAPRLARDGGSIFALRTRHITTRGLGEVFPDAASRLLERVDDFALRPEDAGDAVVAMASGLLDGLSGQVVVLDRGAAYLDNLMSVGPLLMEGVG